MSKKNLYEFILFIWFMNLPILAYAGTEPPASYLNASELLELYSSMYTSIHNMSVSYTDVVEELLLDPNAPDTISDLIRYLKVERIEDGDKFYNRESFSTDPNGFGKSYERLNEYAFDGSVTMEYWAGYKKGYIIPGRTGKSYEHRDDLLKYMLINKLVFREESKLREYYPNGAPSINFDVSPNGKVHPHLEKISGQWCHVVDTIYPRFPGEPKSGGTTIWFAADKGGLPMKFEKYNGYGECVKRIVVEKVAAVDGQVSNVWYPQEAVITTSMVGGTLKYRFVCHELRVNVKTNEDTWKVSFPVGTRVLDQIIGIFYDVGPGEDIEGESTIMGTLGGSTETPPTHEFKESETNIDNEPEVSKTSTEPNRAEVQSDYETTIPMAAADNGNQKSLILIAVAICMFALLAFGGCFLLWKRKNR